MRTLETTLTAVLCLAALLPACTLTGTSAPEPVETGIQHEPGKLYGVMEATPSELQWAAAVALRDYGLHVEDAEQSRREGRLVARTGVNRKVVLTIERTTPGSSLLTIDYGIHGDAQLGRDLFDAIVYRLGLRPDDLARDAEASRRRPAPFSGLADAEPSSG